MRPVETSRDQQKLPVSRGDQGGPVKAHGDVCCLWCTDLYYSMFYVVSIAALLLIFIFGCTIFILGPTVYKGTTVQCLLS